MLAASNKIINSREDFNGVVSSQIFITSQYQFNCNYVIKEGCHIDIRKRTFSEQMYTVFKTMTTDACRTKP